MRQQQRDQIATFFQHRRKKEGWGLIDHRCKRFGGLHLGQKVFSPHPHLHNLSTEGVILGFTKPQKSKRRAVIGTLTSRRRVEIAPVEIEKLLQRRPPRVVPPKCIICKVRPQENALLGGTCSRTECIIASAKGKRS